MTAVDADRSESSRGTDSHSGGRWEALSVPHYRVLFTSVDRVAPVHAKYNVVLTDAQVNFSRRL